MTSRGNNKLKKKHKPKTDNTWLKKTLKIKNETKNKREHDCAA